MITVAEVELTHYRVPVFRRLQARLGEEVTVFHGPPAPGSGLNTVEAGDEVGFAHELLSGTWFARGHLQLTNPLPVLQSRPRAAIVRHSVRNPAFIPMMAAFRARHVPVVAWGQGFSRRRPFRPRKSIRDRVHLAVVRYCDAYVCYTESTRQTLAEYVPIEKLFVARNTLDTEHLLSLRREFEGVGRPAVRRELGLDPSRVYLCFIGRLQARKRPEILLEACARMRQAKGTYCGVLFVGDGPLRLELERRTRELGLEDDVVFAGARYGDEAAKYLFASDVMAMPGWLGLAVVHAFALGVPVVSQLTEEGLTGHPPEAAYVQDGVNGLMAEPGGAGAYAAALKTALARREELAVGASNFAETHLSIDRMVDGFVAAIEKVG